MPASEAIENQLPQNSNQQVIFSPDLRGQAPSGLAGYFSYNING